MVESTVFTGSAILSHYSPDSRKYDTDTLQTLDIEERDLLLFLEDFKSRVDVAI